MTNKLKELFPKAETVFKNLSAKSAVNSKITIPKVEKIVMQSQKKFYAQRIDVSSRR